MSKYTVLLPIAYGGRVEKGSVIEMPDNVAKAFGSEYVVLTEESNTSASTEDVEVVTEINDMDVAQLRAYAKELGISATGSKDTLIERITLHKASTEDVEVVE